AAEELLMARKTRRHDWNTQRQGKDHRARRPDLAASKDRGVGRRKQLGDAIVWHEPEQRSDPGVRGGGFADPSSDLFVGNLSGDDQYGIFIGEGLECVEKQVDALVAPDLAEAEEEKRFGTEPECIANDDPIPALRINPDVRAMWDDLDPVDCTPELGAHPVGDRVVVREQDGTCEGK